MKSGAIRSHRIAESIAQDFRIIAPAFNSPPYTMKIKKINVFYTGESPKNFYIIYAGESPLPLRCPLVVAMENEIFR